MDRKWFRPAQADPTKLDWFIIKLRRAIKQGEHVGFSLTLVNQPHGGEVTEDKAIFPKIEDVWDITRPLISELREEGWEMIPLK
jgi:hypothetical protein